MGILFPGDPEYPDHRTLPSSFPSRNGMVAPVAVTLAFYGLCPANESHNAHGPHQDAPEGTSHPASQFIASGSTSVNSMTWNRGLFNSDDAVLRLRHDAKVVTFAKPDWMRR